MAQFDCVAPKWYFTRKEIEENSPSRKDGIDLKRETCLRKSYCQFLQELGMKLKVPQVTIATAMVFSHRFFLHQSHAKNDRKTVASVCMFLAGKSEETPRPLKDVIYISYEIIYKKDPAALQKIKQKDVYEQQKELFLLGERVVLTTLGFDLVITHSYIPLVEAIKKFKIAQNCLAQVAWNFVNDGLRTSLCLQFKPRQIAAGAIFLAAKFIKVKLPTEGEKAWWQEFDVTPRELEDVSNQLLELYEQNRAGQSSEANEVSTITETSQARCCRADEVSSGGATNVTGDVMTVSENSTTLNTAHDPWGFAAGKEAVGEGNWAQFQNGWGRDQSGDGWGINMAGAGRDQSRDGWGINMAGVGRDQSRDEANGTSYDSINTVESSNRARPSAEQQLRKTRWFHQPGTERDPKRARVEGWN